MRDVIIKQSTIGQFKKGVFANRDFKKGEVVVSYGALAPLTLEEFERLPQKEKQFTHVHQGIIYIYPSPARYVNHSIHPNTIQNFTKKGDVALRNIQKGEEITTDSSKDDVP